MKARRVAVLVLIGALFFAVQTTPVSAVSLKISPLRYEAELASGEKKKGFVDVTNPSLETVHVQLSVQAFRQVNDSGSLEFYDNETITKGVVLDYNEVELGPQETLHLAFVLDGAKLVAGDNFAAIFARSLPTRTGAGEQSVRVGTLLIIQNGTPSSHEAVVEDLSGSLMQLGDSLHVSFAVRNTAEAGAATGFSPTISVTAWPYIDDSVTGPLVFAGRTRTVEYVKKGDYFGVLAIRVKTGQSEQVIYRLAITGHWRVILPFGAIVSGLLIWLIVILKKNPNNWGKSTP